MTEKPEAIEYRLATENDCDAIYPVLEKAAPDIPISLDTPLNRAKMQAVIGERSPSGYSWVASKADGTVVGVALARPDVYEQQRAIYLDYIAVIPISRDRKICRTLME
jgi:L-amino acid N-acyltransferase YncA